jgi:hypothetical protein
MTNLCKVFFFVAMLLSGTAHAAQSMVSNAAHGSRFELFDDDEFAGWLSRPFLRNNGVVFTPTSIATNSPGAHPPQIRLSIALLNFSDFSDEMFSITASGPGIASLLGAFAAGSAYWDIKHYKWVANTTGGSVGFTVSMIPETSAMVMMLCGLVLIGSVARRRTRLV